MLKLKPKQRQHLEEIKDLLLYEDIVVLACSTGYGKTVVSWKLIEALLADKPGQKILVLTHGRKEIRDNFTKSIAASDQHLLLDNPLLIPNAARRSVVVSLPQTIRNYLTELPKFDILIYDEAHQYYGAEMVQKIIQELGIKKQVLLTSTHYDLKYPKVFCSREALFEDGLISDIELSIIPSKYNPDFYKDYVGGHLSDKKKIPKQLMDAVQKLINSHKTLVVMHNVASADIMLNSLGKAGYKANVSHHISDPDSAVLDRFKWNDVQVLVVVNRGNLGFDFPDLANLIDVSFSKNVERLEQLFGRVCRIPTKSLKKRYFKIVPKDFQPEFKAIMSGVLALGIDEIYENWDGHNGSLKILDHKWLTERGEATLEDPDFYSKYLQTFSQYRDIFRQSKGNSVITLADALKRIKNKSVWLDYEGCKKAAAEFKDIAEWRTKDRLSHNFAKKRKWLRPISKDLKWEFKDSWLYEECLEDAKLCLSEDHWSKLYPDSYSYAVLEDWVKYVQYDMEWV